MLLLLGGPLSGQAQHVETSTFNQAPLRPKEDPKAVAHGKDVYGAQCASCHAGDLRGTPTGPNLLRSQPALTDHTGENLVPIMQGTSPDFPDHKYPVSTADANAVAAYIRSVLAQIGSQGRPPGEAQRSPNILVGDATHGKQVFDAKCASCHTADSADIKGIGTRLPAPKNLQVAWLRGQHFGKPAPPVTVTVTQPGHAPLSGTLIHVDDFLVTLKAQDGSVVTVRRNGDVPKVDVKDPLDAHRQMLPTLSDKDIHDITAYLVTLK